jgi:hypothetical protein
MPEDNFENSGNRDDARGRFLERMQGSTPSQAESDPGQQVSDPPADQLAQSYEDLLRRDRELKERSDRVSQREKELQEFEEIRRLARENPLEATRRLGVDHFALGDAILGSDEPAEQPRGDLSAIQQELEDLKQWKQQQEQYNAQTAEKRLIRQVIAESDGCEFLQHSFRTSPGQVEEAIYNRAVQQYEKTREPPKYRDIINELEKELTAQAFALTESYSKINKYKERFGDLSQIEKKVQNSTPPPVEPQQETPKPTQTQSLTLSNDLGAQPSIETVTLRSQAERREAFRKHKFFKG